MNGRLLVCTVVLLGACSETVDRSYRSRTEAEYDGAIAAGWVPDWLPQHAHQIRGARQVDAQAVVLRFSYTTEHEIRLPAGCVRIAASAAPPPPIERAWWPASVPERAGGVEQYTYHQCGQTFVAILASAGEGLVWSLNAPPASGAAR